MRARLPQRFAGWYGLRFLFGWHVDRHIDCVGSVRPFDIAASAPIQSEGTMDSLCERSQSGVPSVCIRALAAGS